MTASSEDDQPTYWGLDVSAPSVPRGSLEDLYWEHGRDHDRSDPEALGEEAVAKRLENFYANLEVMKGALEPFSLDELLLLPRSEALAEQYGKGSTTYEELLGDPDEFYYEEFLGYAQRMLGGRNGEFVEFTVPAEEFKLYQGNHAVPDGTVEVRIVGHDSLYYEGVGVLVAYLDEQPLCWDAVTGD